MKKFFKWINGKKRSISVIGLSALQLGLVKENVSIDIIEVLRLIFIAIGGVGVAHADMKSKKSLIKRITKKSNIKNKQS